MDVERWPIHRRFAGSAVPGRVSAAAVAEAGDVADEDLVGDRRWPLGHRVGGWVIHSPRVV